MTINVNNATFVKTDKEIVNSLFTKSGTASGTYKKYKNRIIFKNLQGEEFAALIKNKYGEKLIVSCRKLSNGKIYYMYGLTDNARQLLNLTDSYREKVEIAEKLADQYLN